MEKDLENISTNEILFEIKQMQAEYEALKIKIANEYDNLIKIEERFAKANNIILKRLKKE